LEKALYPLWCGYHTAGKQRAQRPCTTGVVGQPYIIRIAGGEQNVIVSRN